MVVQVLCVMPQISKQSKVRFWHCLTGAVMAAAKRAAPDAMQHLDCPATETGRGGAQSKPGGGSWIDALEVWL